MFQKLLAIIPPQAAQFLLVLGLSFLVGLEREALKRGGRRTFGGVRTFPLIGLLGYTLAYLSDGNVMAVTLGFAVMGGFMLVSYWYKLRFSTDAGITTELSGLLVFLVGILIYKHFYWTACTIVVSSLFLLELKDTLEGLAERISAEEVVAFTKFMLLTSVILPLVPDQDFTGFGINPYRTWLVVVAVSGVSYGSYVLLKWSKGRGGVLLSGILGGIYSSTITTVVLAKRASTDDRHRTYSGSILAASGMMYLRILVLVGFFNRALMWALVPAFVPLAVVALVVGSLWARSSSAESQVVPDASAARNPLDLRSAFFFAAVFLLMVIGTHVAVVRLGNSGVYFLATVMGVTDVDPFIMGLTQSTGPTGLTLNVAAQSIMFATLSNNVVKGIYAYFFAKGRTGRLSLELLVALSILGLVPFFWI